MAYLCLTKHEETPTFKIWHSRLKWHHITPPLMLQTSFVRVICLFLTALLSTTGNDISQMPNDFAARHWPKTRGGEARSQGISLPLCLGLGCSSAISHLPPGNLPPLDTPGFWVLGTPSPLIIPLALGVIEVSYYCNIWVAYTFITCVTIPHIKFSKVMCLPA